MLRRHWLITFFCLSLFAGIFLAKLWLLADTSIVWFLLLSAVASTCRRNWLTLVTFCLLGLSVGLWRGGVFVQRLHNNERWYGQIVTIVGSADDDATYGKQYQLQFNLRSASLVAPRAQPLLGSFAVGGFGEVAVYRGDSVQVTGKLRPSLGNNIANIRYAKLVVTHRDASALNKLRRSVIAGMQTALPEPMASFAMGLLIGQRSSLPDDVSQQLKQVGLTHMIAVSGYNLTIIVMACRRLLAKRSKYQTTITCLLLMGLFLLVTGSSPPIIRASMVSGLSLWAWYYGRQLRPIVLLLVSAAITVYANPLYLWGNVSWYLSFLSFFGVVLVAPLIAKRLYGGREPKLLAAVTIETVCATVMVLPYSLYIFGQTSLVSLIANVLIVPLVPLAMLLSLLAGIAGMLVANLVGWLAWPAVWLLTYMLDVAGMLSRLPFAYVQNIGFSWRAMFVSYATIVLVLLILQRKVRELRPTK